MRIIDTKAGYRFVHPELGEMSLVGRLGFINHRLNSSERLREERNTAEAELAAANDIIKRQKEHISDIADKYAELYRKYQELVSKSENSI